MPNEATPGEANATPAVIPAAAADANANVDTAPDAYLTALGLTAKVQAQISKQPEAKKEEKPAEEAANADANATPAPKAKKEEPSEDANEYGLTAEQIADPGVAKLLKRKEKILAQRNEAREQLAEKDAEIAKLKTSSSSTPAATTTEDDALAGVDSLETLNQTVSAAKRALGWYEEIEAKWDEDGGESPVTVKEGDKTREYSPKEIKAIRRKADNILRDQAEARERLTTRAQVDAQAREEFTWLNDGEDDRTAMTGAIFNSLPGLKRLPDGILIAAILSQALTDRKAKAKQVKAPVKPTIVAAPPPLGGSGAAPSNAQVAATNTGDNDRKKATDAFLKSSKTADDLADFFKMAG